MKLIKNLFFRLSLLICVILIASELFDRKKKIRLENKKRKEKITVFKPKKIVNRQKSKTLARKKIVDPSKLNLLVEKLNARIDEQTYLFSHYLEQELDEGKIKQLSNNLSDIRKDARSKKIAHLIDIEQINNLQNQLKLYKQYTEQKNKNL